MVGVFDSKKVGTFRLDRIVKRPDILEEDALPFPAGFDFEKRLQTSFQIYRNEYTTIDLICKNDLMDARRPCQRRRSKRVQRLQWQVN